MKPGVSTPTAPSPLHKLGDRIEGLAVLDAPGKKIGKTVRSTFKPGAVKDLLSGTAIGHALHPVLTDVVIGSWTSAGLLDLLGGRNADEAAQRLIMVGVAAYPVTALTGVTDWSDTEIADEGVRRVGLVHAATNSVALSLYLASLRARRRGETGKGKVLALAGAGALTAGGWLGGHLSYVQGVGVDQTTFDTGPAEWTDAGTTAGELPEGQLTQKLVGDTPVVFHKQGQRIHALHDRCSHRGCSLSELAEVEDGVLTCQCHGSRFRLDDGEVLRGPATTAQPAFDVRVLGEQIEIRLQGA